MYVYPRKCDHSVIMCGCGGVICNNRGYALTGSFIYLIAGFNCEKIAVNDTSADARVKYMRARRVLPSVYACVPSRGEKIEGPGAVVVFLSSTPAKRPFCQDNIAIVVSR